MRLSCLHIALLLISVGINLAASATTVSIQATYAINQPVDVDWVDTDGSHTDSDFLALFNYGDCTSTNDCYLSYAYVNAGQTSGSINVGNAPTPGSYEVRYVRDGGGSAAFADFVVNVTESLVAPDHVLLGEVIQVSFTASPWHSTSDEVDMYDVSDNTTYLQYVYVPAGASGVLNFTGISDRLTSLIFRYHVYNYVPNVFNTSTEVISETSISLPTTVRLGEPINVTFSTSPFHSASDIIYLYDEANEATYLQYIYVPAGATGQVSFDGISNRLTNVIAVYKAADVTPIANSSEASVISVTTISMPATVELGQPINVTFVTSPYHSPSDIIYLYDVADQTTYLQYLYVPDGSTGYVSFNGIDNRLTSVIARYVAADVTLIANSSTTSVIDVTSLVVPNSIQFGQPVSVQYTTSPWHSASDIIYLYNADDQSQYLQYLYVPQEGSTGTLVFNGISDRIINLVVRYYAADNYLLVNSTVINTVVSVSVRPRYSISIYGTIAIIDFTTSPFHSPGDTIVMYNVNAASFSDYAAYVYVPQNVGNGTVMFVLPSTPGRFVFTYWIVDQYLTANSSVISVVDATGVCHSSCTNNGTLCSLPTTCTGCSVQQSSACVPDRPPTFFGTTPTDGFAYGLLVGHETVIQIQASDPDSGDTVNIISNFIPDGATFTTTPGNPATATLRWTPPVDFSSDFFYDFVFAALDQYGVGTQLTTVSLSVRDSYCYAWGDPHFGTFDGVSYNFQGIGEYHFLTSSDFDFQIRQAPCYDGSDVTCIKAVAFQAGATRVGLYPDPNTELFILYLNATQRPVTLPSNITLTDQISISFDSSGYVTVAGNDLNVQIIPSVPDCSIYARVGAKWFSLTAGLCGFYDLDPTNDFVLPNNTIALSTNDNGDAEVYYGFGEPWRVPLNKSLFLYFDAQSYNTVNNITATPAFNITWASPEAQQAAINACGNLNLNDVHYQACVFDVSLTNTRAAASAVRASQATCLLETTAAVCKNRTYNSTGSTTSTTSISHPSSSSSTTFASTTSATPHPTVAATTTGSNISAGTIRVVGLAIYSIVIVVLFV